MLFHRGVKGASLDDEPRLPDDLVSQLDGEPVGVVELKCDLTWEYRRPVREDVALGTFEERQARTQRAGEARFFALQDLDDEVTLGDQRRVGATHFFYRRVHQRGGQRQFGTSASRGEHGASNDSTQHVAATFV